LSLADTKIHQLDCHIGLGLNGSSLDHHFGIGYSFRLGGLLGGLLESHCDLIVLAKSFALL
jgi:hypothetical protein